MPVKIKIYGAGSIGNHYAYSYSKAGCEVTIFDIDKNALKRTKNLIYPQRYGKWNKKIKLIDKDDNKFYDIILIGTPPSSHLKISNNIIKRNSCKLLHIEKPLSTPSLKEINFFKKISKTSKVKLICGYNLIFTRAIMEAKKILSKKILGKIISINVYNMEHWGGIFNAHPWLNGPKDSYLGFTSKGGGSLCEHSHGLNLSINFINFMRLGKIKKISSRNFFKINKDINYDFSNFINFKTASGAICHVVQDVISNPPIKKISIQGSKSSMEVFQNFDKNHDAIKIYKGGTKILKFKKKRPDDFKGQTKFALKEIKNKKRSNCFKIFNEAIKTMEIINKCLRYN